MTVGARLSTAIALWSCGCLQAAVQITQITPSLASPQPVGTPVIFAVTATDDSPGPLTFQFSVGNSQNQSFTVRRNFNAGSFNGAVWKAQPFAWAEIQAEGTYTIQVTAKDFVTGETASATLPFTLTSLISGDTLAVVPTANPLVALAGVPPCPAGSAVRVNFLNMTSGISSHTGFLPCQAPLSSNAYLGGLYPGTSYTVSYEIQRRPVGDRPPIRMERSTDGGFRMATGNSTATFTAGQLPTDLEFPAASAVQPATSQAFAADEIILHGYVNTAIGTNYGPNATDLAGNTIWYYDANDPTNLLTRAAPGGYFFLLQAGPLWSNQELKGYQLVREIDLAGNVVGETNIGLLQQQLPALGATDMQACSNIPLPAAIGAACLSSFSHEALQLPNGDWAVIGGMEKIFAPGTQGDASGLNVDVLGDAVIVLDRNLDAIWYWDSFQHDGGGTQLDINRPATLGETCAVSGGGCPTLLLLGTEGVAAAGHDWTHSNSIYFSASDGSFIVSMRNQDWAIKIDYGNGSGSGNILWRMGPGGDFTFNNINNDPFPWFSHQHDAGIETNGVLTVFDDGDTRVAAAGGGNSRGMALSVDESSMQVTPVLSQDLGTYTYALGSAQLLSNGNYFFQPGIVQPGDVSYSQEYSPIAGTTGGTEVDNLEAPAASYRAFRMADLYTPPTT